MSIAFSCTDLLALDSSSCVKFKLNLKNTVKLVCKLWRRERGVGELHLLIDWFVVQTIRHIIGLSVWVLLHESCVWFFYDIYAENQVTFIEIVFKQYYCILRRTTKSWVVYTFVAIHSVSSCLLVWLYVLNAADPGSKTGLFLEITFQPAAI